jgi:MFS family permease
MRPLLVSLSTLIAAVTATSVAEVFFIRDTLGSSATMYGLVTSSWTAGMLIGVWPFGRMRGDDPRLGRVQLVLLVLISLVFLVAATAMSALVLIPVYLVGGVLNAGINVIVGVLVGRRVPAAIRGRVSGTFSAVAAAANLAGYLAGGALLAVLTPRLLIAGSALLSLVLACGFLISAVVSSAHRRPVPAAVDRRPVPAAVDRRPVPAAVD